MEGGAGPGIVVERGGAAAAGVDGNAWTGGATGAGVEADDGGDSAWILNLSLLGSLGTELALKPVN